MRTPLSDLHFISSSISIQTRFLQSIRLFLIFFFFFLQYTSSRISYSPHCSHIVPDSTRTVSYKPSFSFLRLDNAYVADGHQLFAPPTSHVDAAFQPVSVFRTRNPQILEINGTLLLKGSRITTFFGTPQFDRYGPPTYFELSGFWSSSSGYLCMVGSGQAGNGFDGKDLSFNVVLKLNYPNNSTIGTSVVSGRLESLDSEGTDAFFRPTSVLGFSQMSYEYSLIKDEIGNDFGTKFPGPNGKDCDNIVRLFDKFEFNYGGSCGGSNCTLPDRFLGFLPKFMSMNIVETPRYPFVRFFFRFFNSSMIYNDISLPFDPSNSLIAEGVYNRNWNQIRFVACSILMNSSGIASIGDCSVRLNLKFASVLSIRSMSIIDVQMWSNKSVIDVGYFDKIEARSTEPKSLALKDITYEYTETERASRYCSGNNAPKTKSNGFPPPYSYDMKVKNDKKQTAHGSVIPMFVNGYPVMDQLNDRIHDVGLEKRTEFMNVSYLLSFTPKVEFQVGDKNFSDNVIAIYAEGPYNHETGLLCMAGCWTRSASVDCEISIKAQFQGMTEGSIESKRQKTDPLYFEQLNLTATFIRYPQAVKHHRMYLEIIMTLISHTLAIVFLVLQLRHVKNSPEVLPSISIVMLLVITLGHMVSLLLNFFTFLPNSEWKILTNGDWLEMNGIVLVRAMTMIALLLEAYLLHLALSSRRGNKNQKRLCEIEKNVFYLSLLPLCIFVIRFLLMRFHYHWFAPWRDHFRFYSSLVLDAFLLPQIIFNIFCDSKEKALASSYYVGTTMLRLLHRTHRLFRARHPFIKLSLWFIYGNPGIMFYSTSQTIILSCWCVLFAVVIHLQQRFGGRWFLPSRLRERYAYKKVAVAIADNMK